MLHILLFCFFHYFALVQTNNINNVTLEYTCFKTNFISTEIYFKVLVLSTLVVADDTLQNCTLELATLGDLKLVEKPQPVVLAPRDFCNIKANVKVASTENGIIFGNIGKHAFWLTIALEEFKKNI